MKQRTGLAALALLAAMAAPASAQHAVPTEVTEAGNVTVTLHLHPFLEPVELETLRLIAASPEARLMLFGEAGGHAAIAVAPQEGFLRDGVPPDSAKALSQLPDIETARIDSLAACNAVRTTAQDCVVVLELAPEG
jgi:hypothetical protein